MYMKNNQIHIYNDKCVLYVRRTHEILREGSWAYLDTMRTFNKLSKLKDNIVSKSFYENVLTKPKTLV